MPQSLVPWLVFAAAFTMLLVLTQPAPLHTDTTRDLLFARDCADLGRCAMHGPPASMLNVDQGAFWIHFLSAARAFGVGISWIRIVLLALHAAAVTLVYATPRRMCEWPGGVAVASLYLVLSAYSVEYPTLWNPSFMPLPLALFYVCLIAVAAQGELLAVLAASVALTLAIDAHIISTVLVPLLLTVTVATARRPLVAVPVALGAMGVLYAELSPAALIHNVAALRPYAPLIAAVIVVAVLAGLALRKRALGLQPATRARATVLTAAAGALVAIGIERFATHQHIEPRYLAITAPPIALALGGLAAALGTRGRLIVRAIEVLGPGLVVAYFRSRVQLSAMPDWTLADIATLGHELYDTRGYDYRDVFRHLRGPDSYELMIALAAFEPGVPGGNPAHAPLRDDLLVILAERRELPANPPPEWDVVALSHERVAVIRRAPSALDASAMRVCVQPTRPGATSLCATGDLEAADVDASGERQFAQRAYAQIASLENVLPTPMIPTLGDFRWTVSMPVRMPAGEPPHPHVVQNAERHVIWRLTTPGGVPGPRVTVTAGTGTIEFSTVVRHSNYSAFHRWVPAFVETRESESALRALVHPETR